MTRTSAGFLSRLWRVWIVIAVVDGVFATCLSVFAYGSTFTRLWQGVASTVLGASMIDGGAQATVLGLAVHAGVALLCSTMFLLLSERSAWLRAQLRTLGGVMLVSALYGPLVWSLMSLVLIPLATGRPPSVTGRWWFQLAAHVPFVAFPIVYMTSRVNERFRAAWH
ncbi:MAG TPA: hypothetical protein VGE27_11270 [Gemmatimonas sp.]|uniref:hypothetical protein n=1 Tax=Gemmatimonas sp. TaxID=1962908 RepID=UPI002EDA1D2E